MHLWSWDICKAEEEDRRLGACSSSGRAAWLQFARVCTAVWCSSCCPSRCHGASARLLRKRAAGLHRPSVQFFGLLRPQVLHAEKHPTAVKRHTCVFPGVQTAVSTDHLYGPVIILLVCVPQTLSWILNLLRVIIFFIIVVKCRFHC